MPYSRSRGTAGPGWVRVGDYVVRREALAEARDAFAERSEGSRARDRLARAPIETDVGEWRENQIGLDFPGVDTPRDEPRKAMLDEQRRSLRARSEREKDVVLSEEEQPRGPLGSRLLGGFARDSQYPDGFRGRVRDAFRW
jgi:hypothetical protein